MNAFSLFLLLLVTIVWGSTFFIVKDTVSQINEFHIVFARSLLATFPMILAATCFDRRWAFNKAAMVRGAIIGFLLAAIYLSQTIGLKYTSSGHSAFITSSAVVIVPFLQFFLWKVRLRRQDVVAVLIVASGLFLLTYDFETRVNVGDIITLITVTSYALHVILAGRFVKYTNAMSLIAYQFIFATAFSGVGGLAIYPQASLQLSATAVWALLYLGVVGTLFCYFVSVWVQKRVTSLQVALIFTLEPVFAIIFAYLFAGETLHAKEVIGMALILSGVVTYQLRYPPHDNTAAE